MYLWTSKDEEQLQSVLEQQDEGHALSVTESDDAFQTFGPICDECSTPEGEMRWAETAPTLEGQGARSLKIHDLLIAKAKKCDLEDLEHRRALFKACVEKVLARED
jgi:hypothetical protein